jgi:hypothetical protein|tara:strand:+ start:476 stop:733 length:258 start_codon:yes stop_codon:yes gene_type:complete
MFEDFKNIKKPFATPDEIEKYFDIPTSTQKTWRNEGIDIPFFRVKDTIKYPRALIADWFVKQIKNKPTLKVVTDETGTNQKKLKK